MIDFNSEVLIFFYWPRSPSKFQVICCGNAGQFLLDPINHSDMYQKGKTQKVRRGKFDPSYDESFHNQSKTNLSFAHVMFNINRVTIELECTPNNNDKIKAELKMRILEKGSIFYFSGSPLRLWRDTRVICCVTTQ